MAYNLRDVEVQRLAIILPLTSKNTQLTCLNCKFFQSYKDYYEDEGEPTDCGICNFQGDDTIGELRVCDNHTNKE